MSQGNTTSAPYTMKKGVYPVVRFGMVCSPQSTESSSSTQCVLDSLWDRTNLGLMPLMIRAAHDKTICMFDLAVSSWVIDGGIIELDAHVFAPEFYLVGREVRAVVNDDAMGDAIMVYDPGYKVYHRSRFGCFNRFGFYPFCELIHHDQ